MSEQFYDQIVRKFGASQPILERSTIYSQGNPEALFEQKLLELSGKEKVVLDLGCGDGGFTLRLADNFGEVVGIDSSVERIKLAQAELQRQARSNVRFELQNAQQTSFPESTFDLVYSRRGPSPYQECVRILKPGGYFLMISIGEQDAWELKQVFGRGQGYRIWEKSALKLAEERLQQHQFEVTYGQEAFYDEYYRSYSDLDLFLQGVPIFEDFDSEKDRPLLEAYVAKNQTDKGIHLHRHRYLFAARKL